MNKRWVKISVTLFLLLSIATVIGISSQRMRVESENKGVQIIVEYGEVAKLAAQSGKPIEDWLEAFRKSGVYSVAIMEETLLQYVTNHGVSYDIAKVIMNTAGWELLYPEEVIRQMMGRDENSLVLEMESRNIYETIVGGLGHYESIVLWTDEIDGKYYIIIDQTKEDLLYADVKDIKDATGSIVGSDKIIYGTKVLYAPIGFDPEKIETINHSKLKLTLRPVNYKKEPLSAVALYISELEKYGIGDQLILFDGEGVVGFGAENDTYLSEIQRLVKEKDLHIGLTETIEQRRHFETKGLEPLITSLSKDKFVRMFNIWDFVAKRYQYYSFYTGGEEIGNTIFRAVTERNIRAIYFRPFIKFDGSYVTNMEDYSQMFEELEIRLKEHGYHFGPATTFEDFSLPISIKMLLTFQIAIFGLLLLNYIFEGIKKGLNILYVVLAFLGTIGAYYIMPNMSISLTALGATVILSTGSVVYYMKNYLLKEGQKSAFQAIKGLIISSAISLLGALYVATIMADTEFFLELRLFKGVKLSLLTPIAAIILIVIYYYILEKSRQNQMSFLKEVVHSIRSFFNASIKIKYGLILVMVALVGYVYLARSGNESNLQPLSLEIMLRNFLEEVLIARPRTKEFLLAFPAMIIGGFYAGHPVFKKELLIKYMYILVFAVAGVVGQSSITNTFSHIRTPLYLSLARTGYSLVFGIIIGLIGIAILHLLGRLLRKIMSLDAFQ